LKIPKKIIGQKTLKQRHQSIKSVTTRVVVRNLRKAGLDAMHPVELKADGTNEQESITRTARKFERMELRSHSS